MYNSYNKIFSSRLRETLAKSDYSPEQVAKLLNVNPSFLSALLQGKKAPTVPLLTDINFHFNVSIDFLLGLTEFPDVKPPKLLSTYMEYRTAYPGLSSDLHVAIDLLDRLTPENLYREIEHLNHLVESQK